jgi:hypothetical protein
MVTAQFLQVEQVASFKRSGQYLGGITFSIPFLDGP